MLGNGFFKPNISTMVGGLYAPGDSRRDGAFTIFYMGINLGALLSSYVCGTLVFRVTVIKGDAVDVVDAAHDIVGSVPLDQATRNNFV